MPSKRGISKKFNPKCFTSPRKIDKRTRRHKHAKRQQQRFFHRDIRRLEEGKSTRCTHRLSLRQKIATKAKRQNENELRLQNPSSEIKQNKRSNKQILQSTKRDQLDQKRQKQVSVSEVPKASPAAAQTVCREHQEAKTQQSVRVFALGHLRQLLQVVAPNSLVILDIDETLIITENVPSLLLDKPGVIGFQKFVMDKFPDFESRNLHCRRLQKVLMEKTLVEHDTADVVRELQRKNCRVFALTARYVQLAERTHRVLESLGVSFQESAPFPAHPIQDPVTKAVIMNGIVYCNGADKGVILSRLLSGVILPREQKEARKEKRGALAGLHC